MSGLGYLSEQQFGDLVNDAAMGHFAVADVNGRTGSVVILSADVTSALGYTPYNSTNPSGYISSITSGTVTTALGYTPTSVTGLTGIQSVAAFKTGLTLVKGDVGLGSVDNTADAAKVVLSASKLTTARNINGVSFDGTAAITVTSNLAAARTIAMSGDVVWSVSFDGSGNVTAVGTIQSSSVTLAKMANMATASLIYRKTAGTGAPEVNTLATLKTDLGLTGTNSGDQTISLTGDATGSGTGSFAVNVGKINGTALSGLATGILKNTTATGVPSIAVAADFPTLNQNTTGSAATLTTGRNFSLSGGGVTSATVSFDGSAAVVLVPVLGAITPSSVAASGTVTGSNLSGTNTGDQTTVSGNAGTATKLATGRNFSLSGGGVTSATVSFDGSSAVVLVPVLGAITPSSVAASGAVSGAGVSSTGFAFASGKALNMGISANLGNITAYDLSAAYIGCVYDALSHTFNASGTTKLTVASGVVTAAVPVKLPTYTVATLPAAATAGAGATAYVTDALAPTFLTAVVGGGAIPTTVFSDGTSWKAG